MAMADPFLWNETPEASELKVGEDHGKSGVEWPRHQPDCYLSILHSLEGRFFTGFGCFDNHGYRAEWQATRFVGGQGGKSSEIRSGPPRMEQVMSWALTKYPPAEVSYQSQPVELPSRSLDHYLSIS